MNYILKNDGKYLIFLSGSEDGKEQGCRLNIKLRKLTFNCMSTFISMTNDKKGIWKTRLIEEEFLGHVCYAATKVSIYLLDWHILPMFIKLLGSLTSTQIVSNMEDVLVLTSIDHHFSMVLTMLATDLKFSSNSQFNTVIDLVIQCKLAIFLNSDENIYKDLTRRIKATAITITETATESTATLGIESAAQALGQAAAGVFITVAIDVALTSHSVYKAKKEKDQGLITGKQFYTKVKKKVCQSGFQFIGGTTGSVVGQLLIPVPGLGAFVGGLCGSLIGTGIGKGINYGLFDRDLGSNGFEMDESKSFKLIVRIFEAINLRNPKSICVYNEKLQIFVEVTVAETAAKNSRLCAQENRSRSPSPIRDLFTRRKNTEPSKTKVDSSRLTDTQQAASLSDVQGARVSSRDYNYDEKINRKTPEVINRESSCKKVDKTARGLANGEPKERFEILRSYFKLGKKKRGKTNEEVEITDVNMNQTDDRKTLARDSQSNPGLTSTNIVRQRQLDILPEYFDNGTDMASVNRSVASNNMSQLNEATAIFNEEVQDSTSLRQDKLQQGEDNKEANAGRSERDRPSFASNVSQKIAASWRRKSLHNLLNQSVDVSDANKHERGIMKRISSMIESINISKGNPDESMANDTDIKHDGLDVEGGSSAQMQQNEVQQQKQFETVQESIEPIATEFDSDEEEDEMQGTFIPQSLNTAAANEEEFDERAPVIEATESAAGDFNESAKRFMALWRDKTVETFGLEKKPGRKESRPADVFERAMAFLDRKVEEESRNTGRNEEESSRDTQDMPEVESVENLPPNEDETGESANGKSKEHLPEESNDLNLFKKLHYIIRDTVGIRSEEGENSSIKISADSSKTPDKNKEETHSSLNERFKEVVSMFKRASGNAGLEDPEEPNAVYEDEENDNEYKMTKHGDARKQQIRDSTEEQERSDGNTEKQGGARGFQDNGEEEVKTRERIRSEREYQQNARYRIEDEDGEIRDIMQHEHMYSPYEYYSPEYQGRILHADIANRMTDVDQLADTQQQALYADEKITDDLNTEQFQLEENLNMRSFPDWQRDGAQFSDMCTQRCEYDEADMFQRETQDFIYRQPDVQSYQHNNRVFEGSNIEHDYQDDSDDCDDSDGDYDDALDQQENCSKNASIPEEPQTDNIFSRISRNIERMKESLQK